MIPVQPKREDEQPRLTDGELELFEERAAIMEFDGEMEWDKAERFARDDVLRSRARGQR